MSSLDDLRMHYQECRFELIRQLAACEIARETYLQDPREEHAVSIRFEAIIASNRLEAYRAASLDLRAALLAIGYRLSLREGPQQKLLQTTSECITRIGIAFSWSDVLNFVQLDKYLEHPVNPK
ncbi:unnamed protein product [Caenorhabditis auriculariae]|uniref:Uncharacterized protein n=1 Tax=Caenorhabditis auriculariae TaxID=2777116 RepID=A0A8S1H733_9PELO|nr:unnamed protein product [Caenorhabditis auriculariae]